MVQRVYEQARKALERVIVATDDLRIFDAVRAFGGEVMMTRPNHTCGTERCVEILDNISSNEFASNQVVVVNIQGDEPFIEPEQIQALCRCFTEHTDTQIATLVSPYPSDAPVASLLDPNTPKVVFSQETGEALLFSRSVIPYRRGVPQELWLKDGQVTYYRHIGMYAYRADVLRRITQLPPSAAEKAESLEQLRWLENGFRIHVAITHTSGIGIDTPEDLEKARKFLTR